MENIRFVYATGQTPKALLHSAYDYSILTGCNISLRCYASAMKLLDYTSWLPNPNISINIDTKNEFEFKWNLNRAPSAILSVLDNGAVEGVVHTIERTYFFDKPFYIVKKGLPQELIHSLEIMNIDYKFGE